MNIAAEGLLYGMQILVTFGFAGPKLAQAERQRSLSRNPRWVASHPEFLQSHRDVAAWPFRAAGLLSLTLLGAAMVTGDSAFMYAVHGPLFLVLVMGLILYCVKMETKVQAAIPKDSVQRAPLIPRSTFRYLSPWAVLPATGLFLVALALNTGGYLLGSLSPTRALGNSCFILLMAGGAWFGLVQTAKRQPYRTTLETDTLGRRFELQVVLIAAHYFALLGLYYTAGSFGSASVFPLPPTLLHAYIEGQSFPWENFFQEIPYRIVDYSATLLLISILLWTATSRFYRKVLAFRFEASTPIP
ncbi:MAG TPA: hypothetical protein VK465_13325 [Fibrobacteria bacterium]|nr:hypothetical protein [Fibrobacteria bacterium]